MQKEILIVGGGISGLTAAYKLADRGCSVTLWERESDTGGLARSFKYGDFTFDIGPHRFYSSNPEVTGFLNEICGKEFLSLERLSAVHFCNRYHTWPLRLKSVFQMPLPVSMGAFADLFTKGRYKHYTDPNFKNFILAKYGKTLYETFFRGYTEKFLGLSPEQVHYHWAKIGVERATIDEKIKTGSIFQLFCLMLMPKPRQLNFLYPKGGCQQFTDRLRDKIISKGGVIRTRIRPSAIKCENNRITSITADDGTTVNPRLVIWTGSLIDLLKLMGHGDQGLSYLPLLLYNLELSEPPARNCQWCYFGSPSVPFSRTTNPATFDGRNVPGGRGALCVEVTCPENSKFSENPESIRDQIIDGLVRTGSIRSRKSVTDIHIEKIADTYPIYHRNYLDRLEQVRQILRPVENLHLAGRTGLFWYNNMDHSIENAFEVAQKAAGEPRSREEIQDDPFHMGAMVGDPACSCAITE